MCSHWQVGWPRLSSSARRKLFFWMQASLADREFRYLHFQRPSHARILLRHAVARLTCHCRVSRTNCWDSSICSLLCRRGRLERLLTLCYAQRPRLFTLIAFELIDDPEQRAKNDRAVIAGQVYDAGFHDEAAEFDEVPRTLAALDPPGAHVMPCPCRLIPVAGRPVAPERRQCGAQLLVQFAAPGSERTRPHVLPMPPSSRCLSSRPA